MKRQYDFKAGKRGKFYRPKAVLQMPVYLEQRVQSYLAQSADKKGVSLSELVNDLLKKEIAIIETLK